MTTKEAYNAAMDAQTLRNTPLSECGREILEKYNPRLLRDLIAASADCDASRYLAHIMGKELDKITDKWGKPPDGELSPHDKKVLDAIEIVRGVEADALLTYQTVMVRVNLLASKIEQSVPGAATADTHFM